MTLATAAEICSAVASASSASASGHIIAVISKNVTASQAETILTMLTHNATGVRVGNNVTISSTSLYLLHLPSDILSAIPTSVMNAGLGAGPSFLDPLGTICDIANMVFDFLVWVATGGVLLLLAHLVKEGLKAISNLVSTAISAVEAAVDRIVDAFCAFVDWIKEFIDQLIGSIMGSVINELGDRVSSYCANLGAVCLSADAEIEASGAVTEKTRADVLKTICGGLLLYVSGLVMLIMVFFLSIKVVTGGFGFVASLAISALATALVVTALGSFVAYVNYETNPNGAFHDFISGVICSVGGDLSVGGVLCDMLDSVLGLIDIMVTAAMGVISGIPAKISSGVAADVALGIVGLLLGVSGAVIGSKFLEVMALTLSCFGFFKTVLNFIELKRANCVAGKDVAVLSLVLSFSGICTSAYGLSQEEWF